jgi:hypothetical protein
LGTGLRAGLRAGFEPHLDIINVIICVSDRFLIQHSD